jgi:hypothetical protein
MAGINKISFIAANLMLFGTKYFDQNLKKSKSCNFRSNKELFLLP